MHQSHFTAHQALWNKLTELHLQGSETYPITEFLLGKNTLKPLEIAEVGSVSGKKLLHLMCHFGLDTLSWARLGAEVTGVDISDAAIEAAKDLADKTGLDAKFICANVYELENSISEKFDIIFLSYGALYWLPDLYRFAQIVSSLLKPGGFFYIVDGHPFYSWVHFNDDISHRVAKLDYFDRSTQEYKSTGDYAKPDEKIDASEYGWHFTVGDIINSLAQAGLRIDFFHEHPSFDMMSDGEKWVAKDQPANFPKMFSLKATKP